MKSLAVLPIGIFALLLVVPVVHGQEKVENLYFSINIPDSWTYVESSNTPQAKTTGYGPGNTIQLTPSEFSDVLLGTQYNEKTAEGGVIATFGQDTDYRIKNAPLESYVKYLIDKFGITNITSQQYTTVGNEKSVKISANESTQFGNGNIVLYLVMHGKEPYQIIYLGNPTNKENDKYQTQFEKIVKSFRFADGASIEGNGNLTNTQSNFSGANLAELSNSNPSDNKSPQELYDECVSVAGKSLCDFLFKK
jgi:hypothetical protein